MLDDDDLTQHPASAVTCLTRLSLLVTGKGLLPFSSAAVEGGLLRTPQGMRLAACASLCWSRAHGAWYQASPSSDWRPPTPAYSARAGTMLEWTQHSSLIHRREKGQPHHSSSRREQAETKSANTQNPEERKPYTNTFSNRDKKNKLENDGGALQVTGGIFSVLLRTCEFFLTLSWEMYYACKTIGGGYMCVCLCTCMLLTYT